MANLSVENDILLDDGTELNFSELFKRTSETSACLCKAQLSSCGEEDLGPIYG
jgi:hypothetical protein